MILLSGQCRPQILSYLTVIPSMCTPNSTQRLKLFKIPFTHIYSERVEHKPITGVWGQSTQWGPWAEPLFRESAGAKPLKLKTF